MITQSSKYSSDRQLLYKELKRNYSVLRNFIYRKISFVKNILFFTFFYNKNFENDFFMYYFDCAESTDRTLKEPMDTLKNVWKMTFTMVFLLAVIASISLLHISYYSPDGAAIIESVGYIDTSNDDNNYVTNETLNFENKDVIDESGILSMQSNAVQSFIFLDNLTRSQMILTHLAIAVLCLLIATKFQIDTKIYEFFHKNEEGVVSFDSYELEVTHHITSYTGIIFKAVGISCIFLALFAYVF